MRYEADVDETKRFPISARHCGTGDCGKTYCAMAECTLCEREGCDSRCVSDSDIGPGVKVCQDCWGDNSHLYWRGQSLKHHVDERLQRHARAVHLAKPSKS